jgi:2-oxoisovalerate dehydrogenase E1 component
MIELARGLSQRGVEDFGHLLDSPEYQAKVLQALRIRAVESELLALFGRGRLHGTVHTCIGQEFVAATIGALLRPGDFLTSNHRCHGHFIAATGDWRGLVDEVIGNARGVSAGVGSSQHLYAENFISNGIQGGLLPVAAGVALDRKRRGRGNVVVSFMGEGTLGEGVLYETLNLDSLFELPHLIVCENNFYSQTTPQELGVAGDIASRAAAFGIRVAEADTWDLQGLARQAETLMESIRETQRPAFLVVRTYRLKAHSKGDDSRAAEEIEWFNQRDPLNVFLEQSQWLRSEYDTIVEEVRDYMNAALDIPALDPDIYFRDQLPRAGGRRWRSVKAAESTGRFHQHLTEFYLDYMRRHENAWFIGEDIADPYGGAFKISRGMTTQFPDRALTTPISEAGIVGMGNGLALAGNKPIIEVMFGDFMTLIVDQVINNASKFYNMYNQKVSCPIVIRSPMGGRRGYGPTHSQSLERLFVGIDNCLALALNSLADPAVQLAALGEQKSPAILFENKVDYTQKLFAPPPGFVVESDGAIFPTFRIRPIGAAPTASIFCYGGMARVVADGLMQIFEQADVLAELIVPTCIAPLARSVAETGRLVVVEEGASFASVGSEAIAAVMEQAEAPVSVLRLGKRRAPIPSAPALEALALPTVDQLCAELVRHLGYESNAAD